MLPKPGCAPGCPINSHFRPFDDRGAYMFLLTCGQHPLDEFTTCSTCEADADDVPACACFGELAP